MEERGQAGREERREDLGMHDVDGVVIEVDDGDAVHHLQRHGARPRFGHLTRVRLLRPGRFRGERKEGSAADCWRDTVQGDHGLQILTESGHVAQQFPVF
jgi:hypothetical protein